MEKSYSEHLWEEITLQKSEIIEIKKITAIFAGHMFSLQNNFHRLEKM